jgi:hypothetical protein
MTDAPAAATIDPPSQAPLLVLAAFALGQAVQSANGNLSPRAVAWLTAACVLMLAAVLASGRRLAPAIERWIEPVTIGILVIAVSWQLVELFTTLPGIYLQDTRPKHFRPFNAGLIVAAVAVAVGLTRRTCTHRYALPALVLAVAGIGVWIIRTSPNPAIDVFVFQQQGVDALFSGQNPYALRFTDIYDHSRFYGDGLSVDGVLQFGFPYPPLSLFCAAVGRIFFADFRYAQLAAMAGAGLLMARARPSRLSFAAAALFLLTPRAFFVLEQGWTEPFVALGLAVVVFVACRSPRVLPWCLGLSLAVKQYMVLAVPLVWLILPEPRPRGRAAWRWAAKLVLLPVVISLPLAFWDLSAFCHDVVLLQLHQPFRADALSFLAWWAADGGSQLPTALAFVAALAAWVLSLWQHQRTPSGFALGVALTFLGFFALNKQAFCNYYYFVIAAACAAVAALPTACGEPSAWVAAAEPPPG